MNLFKAMKCFWDGGHAYEHEGNRIYELTLFRRVVHQDLKCMVCGHKISAWDYENKQDGEWVHSPINLTGEQH